MGSLNNIVNVSITRQTSVPTRAGFGTGAFVSSDTTITTATKTYASYTELSEDATAGADSLAYGAAYFGQQVSPTKLTIIKEGSPVYGVGTLVFSEPLVSGDSTSIELDGGNIAGFPIDYATSNAATLTAIAAGIEADARVTSAVSNGTDTITVTFADTDQHVMSGTVGAALTATITYTETVAPVIEIVAGLDAAVSEDNDWYALDIHSRVHADILAVAAWVQAQGNANPKLFFAQSSDAGILEAGTSTDIASVLQAGAYFRTSVWYHSENTEYLTGGLVGGQLPSDPGSITWAYKSVSGVTVDTLTSAQKAACHAKACNTYDTVASTNITEEGKVSDSPFEWIDVIRGVDWIQVNVAADLFTALVNNPKIPFDTNGIALVGSIVRSVLETAQGQGILSSDSAPEVTLPAIEDVSAADKGNRLLKDIEFVGILAGAVQKMNVQGTVTL